MLQSHMQFFLNDELIQYKLNQTGLYKVFSIFRKEFVNISTNLNL